MTSEEDKVFTKAYKSNNSANAEAKLLSLNISMQTEIKNANTEVNVTRSDVLRTLSVPNSPNLFQLTNIARKNSYNALHCSRSENVLFSKEDTTNFNQNSSHSTWKTSIDPDNSIYTFQTRKEFEIAQPSTSGRCPTNNRLNATKLINSETSILTAQLTQKNNFSNLDENEDSFVTVSTCKNLEPTVADVTVVTPSGTSESGVQYDIIVARSEMFVSDNNYSTPPPPYYSNREGLGQTPVYQERQQVPPYSQYPPPPNASQAAAYQVNPNVGRTWDSYSFDADSDDYHTMMDFSIRKVRNRFIQRVYTILFVQLLLSFGFVFLCTFEKNVKHFVQKNVNIMYVMLGVSFVPYIVLVCCQSVRRHFPINFILLTIFTAGMGYIMGAISSIYSTKIVMMSIGITAAVCLLVSLFACQTKYDVTTCGMALCICTLVVLSFGIVSIILNIIFHLPILSLIYSCLIAILFTMYLVYDTQQIIGGRRIELSPEEYILGAITLYIDIVQIFLSILKIAGYSSSN